jgi:malate dehydrogenase (oxaloacetate-decarboxylating)
MDRYRNKILSFNDDIQGTGAVALAGLMSARRVHGRPLSEERVVIVGAGAAGLGIFRQIRGAMQADGLTADGLKRAIAVLDSKGLIIDDENLSDDYKREFAWSVDLAAEFDLAGRERDLQRVCERFRPTVLIGTSGQQGLFSEAVVRALATVTERPVILPMSNPTEKCEAVPRDLYAWTDGLALVAAGSPFPDVVTGRRTRRVGQGNNAFIFPGIGLGALQSGAREITDSMFNAAAIALAGAVTDEELASGLLYPPISRLEKVSLEIARAVIKDAVESGQVASLDDAQIDACLEVGTWSPTYSDYEPASV